MIDFANYFDEIIASIEQEIWCDAFVNFIVFDWLSVGHSRWDEAHLAIGDIESDILLHSPHVIEPLVATLYDLQHVQKLLPSDIKALNYVVKGEHVVEVLILNDPRYPRSPKPSGVQNDKIRLRNCVVHYCRHDVGQLVLHLIWHLQRNLGHTELLQIWAHLRHPFLLVDSLDLWVSIHLSVVESPID